MRQVIHIWDLFTKKSQNKYIFQLNPNVSNQPHFFKNHIDVSLKNITAKNVYLAGFFGILLAIKMAEILQKMVICGLM